MYSGDDPLAFVMSKNLARRHLNAAQRAMVAGKIANLAPGSNQRKVKVKEDRQTCPPSTGQAAKAMNVSVTNVKKAKKVLREATPEVIQAVEGGKMSLNAAEKTIKDDKDNKVVQFPKEKQEPLTEKQINIKRAIKNV